MTNTRIAQAGTTSDPKEHTHWPPPENDYQMQFSLALFQDMNINKAQTGNPPEPDGTPWQTHNNSDWHSSRTWRAQTLAQNWDSSRNWCLRNTQQRPVLLQNLTNPNTQLILKSSTRSVPVLYTRPASGWPWSSPNQHFRYLRTGTTVHSPLQGDWLR